MNQVVTLAFTSVLASVLAGCSLLDGPIGPFPGGELRSGRLVSGSDVDWSLLAWDEFIEFQTAEPLRSRTMGLLQHEGQIYVQAELGYITGRRPAPGRWIGSLIAYFKHWHENALLDDRVVLRVRGKRYELQAVRITDPELFATLCSVLDKYAERFMGESLPESAPDPDAVWFFRLDPRPDRASS